MLNKILIILIILFIKFNLNLSSDSCYSINSTCNEIYKFKCGQYLCTLNRKKCKYVNRPKHIFKRSSSSIIIINKCEYNNKINKTDYCLNNLSSTNGCFKYKIIWSLSGIYNNRFKTKCKCNNGLYSFECNISNDNHQYCTRNKNLCDLLKTHQLTSKTLMTNLIQNC